MTTTATGHGLTPAGKKRHNNLKKFWDARAAAVQSDAELAKVCFDRAKAAARSAQRGGNQLAMHELAQLLVAWSYERELDEIRRHTA